MSNWMSTPWCDQGIAQPDTLGVLPDHGAERFECRTYRVHWRGKPLVIASGTPALAAGRVATERDEQAPGGPAAGRAANAKGGLGMAARGVRASVVRLPPSAHGQGDHRGFIARMIGIARDKASPATSATVRAVGPRCTYWMPRTYSASPRCRPRRARCCTQSPTK